MFQVGPISIPHKSVSLFPAYVEHTTLTPVSQAQDLGDSFDPAISFVTHMDSMSWYSHICLQHLSSDLSPVLLDFLRHSRPNFPHGLQSPGRHPCLSSFMSCHQPLVLLLQPQEGYNSFRFTCSLAFAHSVFIAWNTLSCWISQDQLGYVVIIKKPLDFRHFPH